LFAVSAVIQDQVAIVKPVAGSTVDGMGDGITSL
jgi:hypothetical protein